MNLSSRPSRAWYLDENIKKHKLVKVRITNKVSNYIVGSKTYVPGDIVGVPEEYINESFMERIEKPKVVEEQKEEALPVAEEETVVVDASDEIKEIKPSVIRTPAIEPKVKKVRRAKKK